MALYSASVEYGLHCLLYLVDASTDAWISSVDLAEFQGISPSYVAKLCSRLTRAGLVVASEGAQGGYRLGRPANRITVLDVVEALEGHKPLFLCQEIRSRCALFADRPPAWANQGPCSIHAVMLQAETQMKQSLASHTLADLSARVGRKAPKTFAIDVEAWFADRKAAKARGQTK